MAASFSVQPDFRLMVLDSQHGLRSHVPLRTSSIGKITPLKNAPGL